jgi:hypothetical protein
MLRLCKDTKEIWEIAFFIKIMCNFATNYGKENMLYSLCPVVGCCRLSADSQEGTGRQRGPHV